MTTEELLRSRYKVIAYFPYSPYQIGNIINGGCFILNNEEYIRHDCEKYPALFKKLDWWEDRKVEDMPEFIKRIKSGHIFQAYWYNLEYNEVEYKSTIDDSHYITEPLDRFLPA